MQIKTLTIGIPAHNEEKNIGKLLTQLLSQKYHNVKLSQIIVYSDGSTDNTIKVIKNIKNRLIKVLDNKKRQGITYALNQIFKNTFSDILVLLDADISITDTEFIKKITFPIVNRQADLVSVKLVEKEPTNFYSRMLWVSQQIKNNIFNQINNGNNIFNCKGPARAFSKTLYSQITFPSNIANDAFSYVRCKELGMEFAFVNNTEVYYKLVDNFADHQRQSIRFFQSVKINIPVSAVFLGIIYSLKILFVYPFHAIAYLLSILYIRLISIFTVTDINSWQPAISSK